MDAELKKIAMEVLMYKRAFQPMQPQPPPAGGPPPGAGGPPPGAGAPPAGGPPPAAGGVDPNMLMQMMQDPQVQQMLAQAGIQVTPQGPVDQSGQPVPPEAIAQLLQQMGVMPGGAPQGQDAQGMTPEAQGAGAPPPDAGAGAPPQGTPLTVEAFMELMPQMLQQMGIEGKKEGGSGNADLEARVDQLEQMLTGLVQQMGVPPSAVGLGADAGAPAGAEPTPQDVEAQQMGAAADAAGAPPPMPVTASEKRTEKKAEEKKAAYVPEIRRVNGATRIQTVISKLRTAR